jgi:flagellar protein FliO/FliZ
VNYARYLISIAVRAISVIVLLMPVLAQAQEKADKLKQTLPHATAEQMIKMVLGLLFVLFMIFLLAWLFKKYVGVGVTSSASLKAIAGVSVGQKERVVLVQVGERQILVGVAPGQVNMLYPLEKDEEIKFTGKSQAKNPFAEKLKQSLTRMEKQ